MSIEEIFKAINMPMDINCYETSDQLCKAVGRAYFAGMADAKSKNKIIE